MSEKFRCMKCKKNVKASPDCHTTYNTKNGKKFAFNSSVGNIIRDGLIKTIPKLGIQRGTERGNLNVAFKVVYPEKLTEEQIKTLLETL